MTTIDPVSGRIALQDGRVLQMTDRTRIRHERTNLTAVRPGDRIRAEAGATVVAPGATVAREGLVVGDAAVSPAEVVGESLEVTADEILVIRESQAP